MHPERLECDQKEGLTRLVDKLLDACETKSLTLDCLIQALGPMGVPALLLIPTLLLLVPFGFFPGSAQLLAFLSILISGQMVLGARAVWLPKFISRVRLPVMQVKNGLIRLKPTAHWLDKRLGKHLQPLALNFLSQRIIGALIFLLSVIVVVLGFIPGISTIASSLMLILILGILLHDGLIVLVGYVSISVLAASGVAYGCHAFGS